MKKTDYTIKKQNNCYIALKDGKTQSMTFSVSDALHSLWVINNKNPQEFYTLCDDGCVFVSCVEELKC